MTLSGPQQAPRCSETLPRKRGAQPVSAARHILPRAKKPSDRLSGDQNGDEPPSLPPSARVSNVSSDRSQIRDTAWASNAANASMWPSGDTAGPADMVKSEGKSIETASLDAVAGVGRVSTHAAPSAAAPTRAAMMAAA